ncbi:MAG TPA: proline-rich domain-containing protein [Oculatellaceae cyanobacterium]
MSSDATSKAITDEVAILRASQHVDVEARVFIQQNRNLFQSESALCDFALQLEENGLLPQIDFSGIAGFPAGNLTREQLRLLARDPGNDPMLRAFAALADSQYGNLVGRPDGTVRLNEVVDKLTSLEPQFFCAMLARKLSSNNVDNGDGTKSSLFSYLDNAGVTFGNKDGYVGTGNLDNVIDAVSNGDSTWKTRLDQAGITLDDLKTWRQHFNDGDYAGLIRGSSNQFATLDTLKSIYDPATGRISVTDATGAKISFLADGTATRLTADGALATTNVDGTSTIQLPGGAIQYIDANGTLQKIAANDWITTYAPGDASGMRGLQASQLDSPDGALTWRYDSQGWRLHDTARLNAAKTTEQYDASVVGDPRIYMDLMNYLPEQAKDPGGIVLQSKDGSLRITYTADGTIDVHLPAFDFVSNGGDPTRNQVVLRDSSVWKMQDGVFKHFDKSGKPFANERPLSGAPEFDPSHNTVLFKYADNSSKLINADGSSVRTLADGTVIHVGADGKSTSLVLNSNEYFLDKSGSLTKILLADHTQWIRSNGSWTHSGSDNSALPDSSAGPTLPFQVTNGVFVLSSGNPPQLREVVHPNGESTTFTYGDSTNGAFSGLQLTGVVDSSGRKLELRGDGKWHVLNGDGSDGQLPDLGNFQVSVDAQGNVTALDLEEDNQAHHRTFALQYTVDDRVIESINGEVQQISYPDGTKQQFGWAGDGEGKPYRFVYNFTDRSGQVWSQDSHNNGPSNKLVSTDASGQKVTGIVDVDLAGNISITRIQPVDNIYSEAIDPSHSTSKQIAADGRVITFQDEQPQQVTFLDGHVYGKQSDHGFATPEGTFYWNGTVWKTADGAKEADYIELDRSGGISIAVKVQSAVGTTLSVENYYPNGDSLQTTSALSIDAATAKNIAQSIKNDNSKLLPELATLSLADRLAVDDQYYLLTNKTSHLVDIVCNSSAVDKATANGLLYLTGERQNGLVRSSVIELMQIAANATGLQGAQNIAQQQIVYLFGSSTAAQIKEYEQEFRNRYGYDLISAISNAPGISDSFRQALPILAQGMDTLRVGSENNAYLNDASFNALKTIALRNNDVQLFSIAFQYASPEQRTAFKNDPDGLAKLSSHFSGDDLSAATGYATLGAISLHQLVTKNTQLFYIDKTRILTDLATNISDEQRQMYKLGKEISLINNFDLNNPGANKSLADEINAFIAKHPDKSLADIESFYATTYNDLKGAAWVWPFAKDPISWGQVAQYEAYLINGGPTGGDTIAVFDANPDRSDAASIQRILTHLYNMPVSEMQKLRNNPDFAGAVRRDINQLPRDAMQLANIMVDHIINMKADDFANLTNNAAAPGGNSAATINASASSPDLQQPAAINPGFTPSQQLSFDTFTGASDVQLAQDRRNVDQITHADSSLNSLASSNKSKTDILTSILSLSQSERNDLLSDMQNASGPQKYATLLHKFSSQEIEVLQHSLMRLKEETSPGTSGHLPLLDSAETMRLYTLNDVYVNDPGSIVNMLQSMDGSEGMQGDKATKIKMVLEYNQAFHSDVFADALNVSGSEWKDRMVNALTIRPESWKDVINDASFKSMMSETGLAAFALWNDALQGMIAQRDKLQRDLVDWESGKRPDIDLQGDLNSFQASIISYVQAKREFSQNALMIAITIATLPIGAGLSVAGKIAMVGIAGLIELAGMKAAMGNDFDFASEAVPDVLHGGANMAMMLLGGAVADRFLSGFIGASVKTALEAAGVQVGADFGGSLPALVTSIEGKAGADAIRSTAMSIAIKILGKDATQDAINSATDLLISTTTKALQGISIPQRALIMTASMEIVGLSSHSLATIGTSIYENLKTGKPFDMMLQEALKDAGNNLLPTAAAILVGVGLSMLTEVMSKAAESAPDTVAAAKTNISNFVENQIVTPISELIQSLRQAGGQLGTEQILALIDARLNEIARAIDGLMNPNMLAFAAATNDSTSTGAGTGTGSSTRTGSSAGGDTAGHPSNQPSGNQQSPANTGDQPPVNTGDQPPANTGDQPPVNTGAQPPANTGDQPPANTGDQPPANTGNQPPANTGDQPPANTGDQPPANTGDQPPANTGDQSPANTGDQPPANTGDQPPTNTTGDQSPVNAGDQPPADTGSGSTPAQSTQPKLPDLPVNQIPESQLNQFAADTNTDPKVLKDLARLADTVKNAATKPDEFRALTNDQVEAGKLLDSKPLDKMTPSELDTIAKGARIPRPILEALSGSAPPVVVRLETNLADTLAQWGLNGIQRLLVQPAVEGVTGAGNFLASGIQFLVRNGVRALLFGGVAYLVVNALTNRPSNNSSKSGSDLPGNDGANGGAPASNAPEATPTFDVARNFAGSTPADVALKVHKMMKEISGSGEYYGDDSNNSDPPRYITYQDLLSVSKEQSDAIKQLGWDPGVVRWLLDNWKNVHDPSANPDYNGQDVISEASLSRYIARVMPNTSANGGAGN